MKKLAIIIPIYKENLDLDEQRSIELCQKKLSEFDLFFIMPKRLNTNNYEKYHNFNYKSFSNSFFKGVKTYNKLMLTPSFYKEFSDYDYILIAQTDTLVLKNAEDLKLFLNMNYDYIGAPWDEEFYLYTNSSFLYRFFRLGKKVPMKVGNGGFSLRKVDKTISLLHEKWLWRLFWKKNEDCFFACYGNDNNVNFKLAPIEVARQFSVEQNMKYNLEQSLPLAVHKWKSYFDSYESIKKYISD